jgi:hypothetical protein
MEPVRDRRLFAVTERRDFDPPALARGFEGEFGKLNPLGSLVETPRKRGASDDML